MMSYETVHAQRSEANVASSLSPNSRLAFMRNFRGGAGNRLSNFFAAALVLSAISPSLSLFLARSFVRNLLMPKHKKFRT